MSNKANDQNRLERHKSGYDSLELEVESAIDGDTMSGYANLHYASWISDTPNTLLAMGVAPDAPELNPAATTQPAPSEQLAKVISIDRANQIAQDAARSISEYQNDAKSAA